MAPVASPAYKLRSLYSGSSWEAVANSVYRAMLQARTPRKTPDEPVYSANGGASYPPLTNREAVALIEAWRSRSGPSRFPLWYALAASAYGWQKQGDSLDTSDEQAERWYDGEDANVLWMWTGDHLASDMDDERIPDPSIHPDQDTFDDKVFVATVRAEVEHDGARDHVEMLFKHPVPGVCKDENGNPVKPVIDKKTRLPKCEHGPYLQDDPITAIVKKILNAPPVALAGMVLVAWLVYTSED